MSGVVVIKKGLAGTLVKAALLAPLFAIYGLWCLGVAVVKLIVSLGWARRLMGRTITCPTCGEANALDGRWSCASCSATYLGFVGACPVCRAGAWWFPCRVCGAAITIRARP